jgi:biopolymer transport protein ExbD
MSTSSNFEKCEPNLTPLLDVVLQLVMFFMLCANFVMESVNESIKLPVAIESRMLDKNVKNYIILNIDAEGKITVGKDLYDSPARTIGFLRNQYEFDKARAKPAEWEQGKGRSVIILRAHKDCNFKQVNDVLEVCRRVGYLNLQLRTIKG